MGSYPDHIPDLTPGSAVLADGLEAVPDAHLRDSLQARLDRLLSQPAVSEERVVETMVAAYRPGLYRFACSALGDPDEAEDAVQQAFIQAAAHLGRYQPGTNFKAWLYTIAVNTCRGTLRKRKARQALARLLGREATPTVRSGELEDRLAQREAAGQLWTAVAQLDEKYRLVVLLRFEQELSIAEIAQVLSVRPKTVYTRLYEALRRLRGRLAGEMAEPERAPIARKETQP